MSRIILCLAGVGCSLGFQALRGQLQRMFTLFLEIRDNCPELLSEETGYQNNSGQIVPNYLGRESGALRTNVLVWARGNKNNAGQLSRINLCLGGAGCVLGFQALRG